MDIRDRVVELRRVRASEIRPHPNNWRGHPPEQKAVYRLLLEEIGFAGALLCYEDEDGLALIDGHLRQDEHPDAVLPALVTDLTAEEAETLLFGYDSVGAMAKARMEKLAELKAKIEERRAALPDWEEERQKRLKELTAKIAAAQGIPEEVDAAEDPGAQIDRAAELQEKWQVERGQVWVIPSAAGEGEHRIMCGDSTDEGDVARLMGNKKFGLIVADPPYGVNYHDTSHDGNRKSPAGMRAKQRMKNKFKYNIQTISGDSDPTIVLRALAVCSNYGLSNWNGYIFCATITLVHVYLGVKELQIPFHMVLIWAKDIANPTFRFYKIYHELIALIGPGIVIMGTKSPMERWYGNPKEKSVWEHPAIHSFANTGDNGLRMNAREVSEMSGHHPTMKPLSIIKRPILNSSKPEEIIYDPFLGSGTTVVACEQTGRIGYGMEIAPEYVAVSLERLSGMGLEPRPLPLAPSP